MDVQLGKLFLKGVMPGKSAQHDGALTDAHRLRGHDLVGIAVGQNAVLVNARLVSKSVLAHNGLIDGNVDARNGGNGLAGLGQHGGLDVRLASEDGLAHL